MEVKSNYDIQADKCKLEFIKMDHKKIAAKFNLNYDENYLYIFFYNQKYRLNKKTGDVEKTYDGKNFVSAKYNEIMTFLDLFAYCKDDLSLSGKWINVTNLKQVFKTGRLVTHTDLFGEHAKRFSGKIDKLKKSSDVEKYDLAIALDCADIKILKGYTKYFEKAKTKIVIDHHRRGVEFIKDTVLLFHEIYVSSTCEMVTELIQYLEEDVKINKLTAEGLLAGINLDTKFFAFKTGVRTFEAASYLKKIGADTVETKMLFKSNVEDFIARADIIKNTKIINKRICIAYSESEISNINVVIAKAADELLNIKNVEASFILGHKNDTVFISARSLGQINVHVLMEKLGGGGHIDIAGAQLKNVTLNQAYKKVHQIIEEYLEEENQ